MSGAKAVSAVARQAEQLKLEGNNYFKKDRIGAAIDAYTEAIVLCPNVPVYFTNRALCHRKRNDWSRVEEDCRSAIKLDHRSVKAHYMLGLALLQKKEYAGGVRELEKALELGRGADMDGYMVEEIWQELARAKYLAWQDEPSKRSIKLRELKEACEEALSSSKHASRMSQSEVSGDDIPDSLAEVMEQLQKVFKRAAEDDTPSEIPEYLCCQNNLRHLPGSRDHAQWDYIRESCDPQSSEDGGQIRPRDTRAASRFAASSEPCHQGSSPIIFGEARLGLQDGMKD